MVDKTPVPIGVGEGMMVWVEVWVNMGVDMMVRNGVWVGVV